ncbi:MAG: cysteine hydrolase [Clostridia bacterium]|nr:cysteine hydrolase [Clostridia bacterium]
MKNKALVIIDIQNDITKNYREIIENINQAIDWAVASDIPVVYIKHNNLSAGTRTFKPGTHGAELVPELNIVSENIFLKTKGNALTSEDFAAFVSKNEIGEFYIAGADAVACVKSTCYNMAKGGYIVHVLSDCITSYDKRKINEMLQYYESNGCIVEKLNCIVAKIGIGDKA